MRLHEGCMGVQEMSSLIGISMVAKLVLRKDMLLGQGSANPTWYTIVVTGLTAAALLILALYLGRDEDLCTAMPKYLGKPLGNASLLIFGALMWFLASLLLAELFYLVRRAQLPNTPSATLLIALLLGFVPLSFFGLESLGRTAKLLLWVFVAAVVGLLLLTMRHFEAFRLYPMLGQGVIPSLSGGVSRAVMCADVLAPAIFMSALQKRRPQKQAGWIGLGGGIVTAFALLMAISLLFAPDMLKTMAEPLMRMADIADIGEFFMRVQPLFFFVWFMIGSLGIAFSNYSANYIYCRTFGIQDIRPVTALSAPLCVATGYLLANSRGILPDVEHWVDRYGVLLLLGPLLLAGFSAFIRRRKEGASCALVK